MNDPVTLSKARTAWGLGAAGLGLVLSLSSCSEPPPATVTPTPRVKVFEVGKRASGQTRRISGTVVASGRTVLSFGVDGQVVEVIATTGQRVTEGQLLARLDEAPLKSRLEEARASLTGSRAMMVEAQATYDRVSGLIPQKAASQKDLDAATAGLASADASLKAAQQAVEQADRNFARTRLVAPYDGSVVEVPIDPFQEVGANSDAVLLQSDGALDVEVLVPETLIRDVDFGQVVQVRFPTLEDVTLEGYVRLVGADVATGNAFAVKVRLKDSEVDLRAGMTASVTFNFTSYLDGRTAYLVPMSALAIDAGLVATSNEDTPEGEAGDGTNRAPLFVVDPEAGVVRFRMVEAGDLRGNEIEVFGGLEAGEMVVSAGVAFLRDGAAVRIWEPRR